MTTLRRYQQQACRRVHDLLAGNCRSVLLVAPTGSGKTVMAVALIRHYFRQGKRILVCAHRTELIRQTLESISNSSIGPKAVGCISPNYPRRFDRPIQVASIQTLTACANGVGADRWIDESCDFLFTDEAHHYNADDWSNIFNLFPGAMRIGLTATPVRADGRPLGDNFEQLVVAANYSELIAQGHIVPCKIYQPERGVGSNECAQDPLAAYQAFANGALTFGFTSRVEQCFELASRFTDAGIPSAVIEAKTDKLERACALDEFRAGKIRVLWNVYALTEGVDVPEASCVIIARRMDHVQMYLQACGRVLRPAPNKSEATIIDLSGATLLHGFPTEDREYSLTGTGIKRTSAVALRVCSKCGATSPAYNSACPECGYVAPMVEPPKLRLFSMELREVYRGASTPEGARRAEYLRLREEGRKRGWNLWFIIAEYKKLFGEDITIEDATKEEKEAEFFRLSAIQTEKGYKPGWVSFRFKSIFGHFPRKGYDYDPPSLTYDEMEDIPW